MYVCARDVFTVCLQLRYCELRARGQRFYSLVLFDSRRARAHAFRVDSRVPKAREFVSGWCVGVFHTHAHTRECAENVFVPTSTI